MAFKMKGFPYKSGFKHTDGEHEDHHQKEEETPSQSKTIIDPTTKKQEIERLQRELKSLEAWWNSESRTKYPVAAPSTKRRIAEIKARLAELGV